MPALQLPEPSTEKLEHSPLELVVCQVRHERNLAVADAKRALEVHRGLGGKYPVLDEAAGIALNIPAGVIDYVRPAAGMELPVRRWGVDGCSHAGVFRIGDTGVHRLDGFLLPPR